ncbi:MAG: hypothetical protein IT486_02860 [Gammaproteobacteria bacterium]|nr:hypothetical protein [Gammaproteobacteria bacterium]
MELKAGLSGPLIPGVLFGGLNAATWNNDGFYDNSYTGNDTGGAEGSGVSGDLLWNITDAFTARVRAEYTNDEFSQSPYSAVAPTETVMVPASALGTVISPAVTSVLAVRSIPDGDDLQVTNWANPRTGGDYPGADREVARATLTLDYDFGPVALKSLTHVDNAFDDDTVKSTFGNTYNSGIRVVPFPPPFTFVLPLNQTPIKPDERSYGVRVGYRFGG